MTLRHLLIFIEVAKCGKMSKAASNLFISQPTVSQVISELESHYNVKLFERYPKSLYITEKGKIFLEQAKQVIESFNTLEDIMKNPEYHESIHIGVTVTVGSCVISTLVKEFKKKYPSVKVKIYVSNTRNIEEKLLKNELDLGLVEGIIKSPILITKPIINDYLVLVCGNEHPILKKEWLELKDLEKETFILRENGSGTRELFINFLYSKGIDIDISWECSNPSAIIQGVIDNLGLSVISARLVENEVKNKKIHIIHTESFLWPRAFKLVYHKNKYTRTAIKNFSLIAQEYGENNQLYIPKNEYKNI